MPPKSRRSEPRVGYDFPDLSISSIQHSPDSDSRVIDYLDESSFIEGLASQGEIDNQMQIEELKDSYSRLSLDESIGSRSRFSTYTNQSIEEVELVSPSPRTTFNFKNIFDVVSNSLEPLISSRPKRSAEFDRRVLQPSALSNNNTLRFVGDISSIVPSTRNQSLQKGQQERENSPIARLSLVLSSPEKENRERGLNASNAGKRRSCLRSRNELCLQDKPNPSRSSLPTSTVSIADQGDPHVDGLTRPSPLIDKTASFLNRVLVTPSSEDFASPPIQRVNTTKLVFTGLPNKKVESELKRLAETIGLEYSKEVNKQTRYVISGSGARRLTVLQAVVNEIPIVTPEWLQDSAAAGRPLSYKKYVHEDWSDLIKFRQLDADGGVCRLLRSLGLIFVHEECTKPSAIDLCNLIRKSGGTIVRSVENADLLVCSKDVTPPTPPAQTQPFVTLVNEKYILDCITRNEVLDFDRYSRTLPDVAFLSSDSEGELLSD